MNRIRCSRSSVLAALAMSCAALAGCADSELSIASEAALDPSLTRVRVVHGAATVGPVDIYVDGGAAPAFTAVAFGSATDYATLPPGPIRLVFRPAGAPADAPPVHTSGEIALAAGGSVTAVAGGLLGSSLPTAAFRVQPYLEAFGAPEPGRSRVRFVNDSHGLATAGFDLGADGAVEVPALASFSGSDPAGIAVSRSRSVQLAIETGAPANRLTAFTLPPDVLAKDGGVFLTLVGVPTFVPRDVRSVALLAVGPAGATLIRQNPTVFVLPAIPDRASVDIHAFGLGIGVRTVGEGVGFGALAPALQVPPSSFGYGLLVTDAADCALALEATGPLVAGERYLAVASGFGDDGPARPAVTLTILRDGFDRATAANGRLRAVAAAADAPAVDVGQFPPGDATPFTPLAGLEALAYRAASAEAGVQPAAAPLNPGVRPTGGSAALRFRAGALLSTDRAFGVVAGAFAPATGDVGPRFIVVKALAGGWTAQAISPLP